VDEHGEPLAGGAVVFHDRDSNHVGGRHDGEA
jgi:hypothetical protein